MADKPTTLAVPDEQRPLDQIPISPLVEKAGDTETTNEGAKAPPPDADKPITIFHSQEYFTHKHPLMNTWTLWFTKPPTGKGVS